MGVAAAATTTPAITVRLALTQELVDSDAVAATAAAIADMKVLAQLRTARYVGGGWRDSGGEATVMIEGPDETYLEICFHFDGNKPTAYLWVQGENVPTWMCVLHEDGWFRWKDSRALPRFWLDAFRASELGDVSYGNAQMKLFLKL